MFMAMIMAMNARAALLPPPEPDRFVYDYAGVMGGDARRINNELVNFSKETSNQIAVVTVTSLQGLEPAEFAYTLGDEWGVGSQADDNGVVVLIKPKTDDTAEGKGQVFIATGRGLEGAIPDAYCDEIVRRQMMPRLKQNDYDGAVNVAIATLMNASRGEYDRSLIEHDNSDDKKGGGGLELILLLALIFGGIFVFALLGNIHPRNKASALDSRTLSSHGVIDWNGVFRDMGSITLNLLLMLLSSRGGSGGSSRSSGSSGGHSFGGGSFGGGGAGGSW